MHLKINQNQSQKYLAVFYSLRDKEESCLSNSKVCENVQQLQQTDGQTN